MTNVGVQPFTTFLSIGAKRGKLKALLRSFVLIGRTPRVLR
jgi:hypothetical protein